MRERKMNKSQLIFLIAFLITGCDDEVIKPSCLTAVEKGRFIGEVVMEHKSNHDLNRRKYVYKGKEYIYYPYSGRCHGGS
tara:strand:- start:372 stop:611 length:240 start_codon:yes stop_codon:yes gene_type:complete